MTASYRYRLRTLGLVSRTRAEKSFCLRGLSDREGRGGGRDEADRSPPLWRWAKPSVQAPLGKETWLSVSLSRAGT